ncbi:MAG: cation:proton antiporter [Phycisphaerales bacterium]
MLTTLASSMSGFAVDMTAILVAAGVFAAIFRSLKLESIPGFLLAGVLIGPHVGGLIKDPERVTQISDLAVILLMFGIGLHLDMSAIRRGMVHILAIGIASTLAVVGLSWIGLIAAGLSTPQALLISMGAGISSTAVFVRVTMARRELQTVHGRVGLGVSIAQDIITVAMLALLPPLARWAGGPNATGGQDPWAIGLPLWLALPVLAAKGLGGVTIMVLLGRYLLPKALGAVAKLGSGELMLVASMAVAMLAAVGTKLLGFSAEMGAFLGGLLLAATPYRYQLSGLIAPLRDLLMAIFFTAVGLAVDPSVLVEQKWLVLGGVLMTVFMKSVVIGFSAWAGGVAAPSAALTGVYLGNAGEFTIVIGAAAFAAGGLTADQAGMLAAVVTLSLVVSSLLISPAHTLAEALKGVPISRWGKPTRFEQTPPANRPAHAELPHVIIAGFGPVGRTLADRFERLAIPFVVVELNPKTVERQSSLGRSIVYGDVTNADVLEKAGIHGAAAIIITIPDDEVSLRACSVVRALAPQAFIAARTSYLSGSFRAQAQGADHVTVEEIATAQAMEREVLAKISPRYAAPEAHRADQAGTAAGPTAAENHP